MASDQTVSLRLEGDSSDLRRELDQSAKSMDNLAGAGRDMGADIDKVMRGVTESGDAVDQTIRGIDQRLDSLTGQDRAVFIAANVAQAEAGIRQIDQMLSDPSLTDAEITIALDKRNQASRKIEELKDELGELGQEGREAAEEIERGFDGMALAGAVGSASVASRLDDASTSAGALRAQLGLVGDEAREFDAVSKEVYRNNFGETMGHASQVTGMVHQSLGLVDEELGAVTMSIFSVSDAFEHVGADTQILTDGLRVMKASWPGIDETESLDLIAHSFQSGTGNAGDLLDTVQEYGPVFADMGFSADDMFTILNEGMENGARNTDFLADAFKELGIRIQTEGDTGQQAIRKLFPAEEAERLITDFTRGGDAGRAAFQTIAGALVDVKDPQDQYNLSIELFGTKAEDLSTSLIPTLTGSLEGLASTTNDAAGAAASTEEQYTGFRNTLDGLMRTLETSVVGGLGEVGIGFADVGANVGIAVLGMKGMSGMLPGLTSKLRTAGKVSLGIGAAVGGIMLVKEGLDALGLSAQGLQVDLEKVSRATTDELVDGFRKIRDVDPGEAMKFFGEVAESNVGTAVRLRDALAAEGEEVSELDAALQGLAEGQSRAAADADAASPAFTGLADDIGGVSGAAGVAVGPIEGFGGVLDEAADPAQELADSITAIGDALRGQMDPLFAAQDAMLGIGDAMRETDEANLAVLGAQEDYTKAVKEFGRKSPEATKAEKDLADAHRRADQASRDAARSALDLDTAMLDLKAGVEDGTVSIEHSIGTIDRWAAEGKITEDQAKQMRDEFYLAALSADELNTRSITVPMSLDARQFWDELARARFAVAMTQLEAQAGGARTAGLQLASGGLVPDDPMYLASGGGPRGTDIVPAWLTPGEFVVRAPAVEALGMDAMNRINHADRMGTSTVAAGGAGMASSSRSTTLNVYYPTPEPVSNMIGRATRKIELANA